MDMRDERREVTALFADLVGSTSLGERLDPEELKLVVGDAVGRMVTAVEAFGGTVKDLAGDGVLALFGAPVAHEDDVERAIRAGLRIVEDVTAFGAQVAHAWGVDGLSVRVAVQTGPAVTGAVGGGSRIEYGAMGDALNTAARLQSEAEPGTVLVGADAHAMTGSVFTWGPPRHLRLKGKEDAVTAFAVTGVTGAPARSTTAAPMVGREAQLGQAREAAAATLDGAGRILDVTGEPGIGKTRLLTELRRAFTSTEPAHGRTLWLEGRCVSYGESLPYFPFRDLVRSWLGVQDDEPELRVRVTLRRHLDRLFGDEAPECFPYLAALLELEQDPVQAHRLAELAPEAMQYRTFEVVRSVIARLAEGGPVAVVFEDLHWADATSLLLIERLASDTESSAILLATTSRLERDHLSWRTRADIAGALPHRVTAIELGALSGDAGRDLLHALVGAEALPEPVQQRILGPAEGNPFFLEELVRSLVDAGALSHGPDVWRYDDTVVMEVPPTVEKVLLARIDRLEAAPRSVLMAAAVIGRTFGKPLLEALVPGANVSASLTDLMRVDLVREGRRWPEPEYSFKHALIQETAYRTLVGEDLRRLHRAAAEWLEARTNGRGADLAGLLAHHYLGAEDDEAAIRYLTIAGDRARQDYALDEAITHYRDLLPLLERRGEDREIALVLFKLALALHVSLRFAEANDTYQRAFTFWTPPEAPPGAPSATLRMATSFLPDDPDPRSAIAWPNIQLCMQLFDRLVEQWPERTIVPSLAERWEIDPDGLRYVFHLREGLTWSDGTPLTASDVEFGIKRVLDPRAPGSSVAIYFALERGQEYYLGTEPDPGAIGVRALDDRTVEFRLVAPAPYFMSVLNRPDGGPQPAHAVGEAWTGPGQVVSGAFRIAERSADRLVLQRRETPSTVRRGNVTRVEMVRTPLEDAIAQYEREQLDLVAVRYTPRLADLLPRHATDQVLGPPAWSGYLAFGHDDPVTSRLELRRALAHAVDREALAGAVPPNMVTADGGIVPPALQGHTPDIALRFDPDLARSLIPPDVATIPVGFNEDDAPLLEPVLDSWRQVLGVQVEARTWGAADLATMPPPRQIAPVYFTGWLPGYPDPEYFLRLLFQSDSRTNEGGFAFAPFDDLIERARQERSDAGRLRLFHDADRMAVVDRVAVIPMVYGRSLAIVKPGLHGWWEFGKTAANFADLDLNPSSQGPDEGAP